MPNPNELSPQQHVTLLRKAFSQINRITKSVRREPKDTDTLRAAETSAEQHLLALEIWAAATAHE